MRAGSLAAALLLGAVGRAAEFELPASTSAHRERARPAPLPENPWVLEFRQDERDRAVRLDYRLRWDLGDLSQGGSVPRPSPRSLGRGVGEGLLDILHASRLNLYGVRVRPFHSPPPAAEPAGAEGASAPSTAAARGAAARRPRPRLSLDAAWEDLRRSGREGARRWLIREAFDHAVPDAREAPYWQKEGAVRALRESGESWGAGWEERRDAEPGR